MGHPAHARHGPCATPRADGYRRHRPEESVLYRVVQDHLEAFLRAAREADRPLPRYVERELRAYLECGILAHGFARAECRNCGKEMLVAFSCKRRGLCPSCNARRMCNTAAHLVDRVVPEVPVRQWVLSVPFELRLLLARRADAFGRLIRIFAEEVQRWQRAEARSLGIDGAHSGGLSFPQRFGGSLNLNTHVHSVFPDGVFTFADPDGADRMRGARFHALPAPDTADLTAICQRTADRFHRWLRRRGLLSEEADVHSNEPPERSALDACTAGALGVGELACVDDNSSERDDENEALPRPPKGRRSRYVGEASGYHLHAAVAVPAHNRLGRELLLRYCARPPLSLERLSLLPDGRVAYRIKKPWRPDRTHRVMTPTEFLARIAALIPPPRTPLIRFHGVFAPHFRRRKCVVPAGSSSGEATAACSKESEQRDAERPAAREPSPPTCQRPSAEEPKPVSSSAGDGRAAVPAPPPVSDFASAPWRIDWATLLRRVHDIDALTCRCGGRLRFVEVATEPATIKPVLQRLGHPVEPPRPRPASATPELIDLPPPDW